MNNNTIYPQLAALGLTKDQVKIYELLIQKGFSRASILASRAGIQRSSTYIILEQLEKVGLVERVDRSGKVTLFYPTHPSLLQKLVDQKRVELEQVEQSLHGVMASLVSQYNYITGKPNVQFYEGIEGIKKLYQDIITEGEDILLIRSPFDKSNPERKELVEKQIQRQIEHGIHARVLVPERDPDGTQEEGLHGDWIECRIILDTLFLLPAQIVIYGKRIGLTAYKEDFTVTIIESDDLATTFKILFEILWKSGKVFLKK